MRLEFTDERGARFESLTQPRDSSQLILDGGFLQHQAAAVGAHGLAAQIPAQAHLAEVAGADALDERQVEPLHAHATRDERVHQHAVDRGGGAVLVVVFGGFSLDALRQGLEVLAHGVGDLLLQVFVFATSLSTGDRRLVQIEQHILVHHVFRAGRTLHLFERLLCLVEQEHVDNLKTGVCYRLLDCVENPPVGVVEFNRRPSARFQNS